MCADDTPSTIFFLVNRNAPKATVPGQGRTAQENEPKNTANGQAEPELCSIFSRLPNTTSRKYGWGGLPALWNSSSRTPYIFLGKWDVRRKNLKSVQGSDHFPRDTGLMYADDSRSTIFFLVNGNAPEATVPAQGRTAQENEPKNAPNAGAQPEVGPFLSDRLTHRIRTDEGGPVRLTTKFRQVPLYLPQLKRYAQLEYAVKIRVRPLPALGQSRVLRSRFHRANLFVGTVDVLTVYSSER